MKRTAGALVLMAALGGCVSTDPGPSMSGSGGSCGGWASGRPTVPGVQGPWGQPVAMAAPYSANPPGGAEAARAMMALSLPLDLVQVGATGMQGGGLVQAGGISPMGAPFQPLNPGVSASMAGMGSNMSCPPGGACMPGGGAPRAPATKRTEVRFVGPSGMKIAWFAPTPDGKAGFTNNFVTAPARYNFVQGAIYRLKLSNIANRPGVELYPTIEVVPSGPRSDAFLAHSAVPISFTDEDFEQVASGNYVVKVIYLPDPHYQDLATIGPDEVVSSRLEPGTDPIAEAHRRGNVLVVVRLGNIDLEAPNTPGMDAPAAYGPKSCPPGLGLPPGVIPDGVNGALQLPPGLPPGASLPEGTVIEQMQYKTSTTKAAATAANEKAATEKVAKEKTSTEKKDSGSKWWTLSDKSKK